MLARHLGADLTVGCEPIAVPQHVVEHPVELELAGGVLVIALDHVETHGACVFQHLHEHRAQALELVYVVAVRL